MAQHFNPTDSALGRAARRAAICTRRWCRSSATRRWSQALGPDAARLDVPARARRPTGTCRCRPMPDVWIVYRSNPAISFWESRHAGRRPSRRFPFTVALRLHGRRDQLHGGPAAAGGHRSRIDAADPRGRAPNSWSSSGIIAASRCASPRLRRRAKRAISPGSAPRLATRTGLLRAVQRRAQSRHRRRRAAQGHGLRLQSRSGPRSTTGGNLGRRLPRRDHGALRRQGDTRPCLVQGARVLPVSRCRGSSGT